jgi:hypothetical protein
MLSKTALRRAQMHPSGKAISFDPKWHSYSMAGVGKLRSVSSILNKYFPFDAPKIAKVVADKSGRSVDDVLQEWKMSAVLGSNVHAHIEAQLLGTAPAAAPAKLQGNEDKFFAEATKAVARVTDRYEVVAVEQVVADIPNRIAGTIDLIARNKATGAILVGDWKTSGANASNFSLSSFDGPCPAPLHHLPNNKTSRYALQVLAYGAILKSQGYGATIDKAIDELPLEYGIIKFSPDAAGDGMATEFILVTDASIEGIGAADPDAAGLLALLMKQ